MKRSRLLGMVFWVMVPALLAIVAAVVMRHASAQLSLSNEYELAVDE